MKNEIEIFKNERLGEIRTILNSDGSISVNAEDTARGFGWTQIKNDKEYEKSFFIKNWKIILFGIYLKKDIDYQNDSSNNGYEYEEFLSSIENFEELKESKKIIKYFPDSVASLDTTIIIDNDKKYFIEVFKSSDDIDENYCGSTEYYFLDKFIDTIVGFYSMQQTDVVDKFRALVEYYFSGCEKCKFFSTCNKQEHEKGG